MVLLSKSPMGVLIDIRRMYSFHCTRVMEAVKLTSSFGTVCRVVVSMMVMEIKATVAMARTRTGYMMKRRCV